MAVAIKVFHSVGVSVIRFCLLKFGAILRDDQRIYWKYFGFAVERQLEAVFQKRLKHASVFKLALIIAKLLHHIDCRFFCFGIDIVQLRNEPVRCS